MHSSSRGSCQLDGNLMLDDVGQAGECLPMGFPGCCGGQSQTNNDRNGTSIVAFSHYLPYSKRLWACTGFVCLALSLTHDAALEFVLNCCLVD